MKNFLKILAVFTFVIVLAGCGTSNDDLLKTCTLYGKDTERGYELNSTYKVYGENDIVTSVSTTEVVTSDSDEVLEYFEESIGLSYSTANKLYGGYKYNIEIKGNKLTSRTTIDYSKMNLKAFVEDNPELEDYVNSDNKLTVDGITKLYEEMGAICY